jgi:hypothetical protein
MLPQLEHNQLPLAFLQRCYAFPCFFYSTHGDGPRLAEAAAHMLGRAARAAQATGRRHQRRLPGRCSVMEETGSRRRLTRAGLRRVERTRKKRASSPERSGLGRQLRSLQLGVAVRCGTRQCSEGASSRGSTRWTAARAARRSGNLARWRHGARRSSARPGYGDSAVQRTGALGTEARRLRRRGVAAFGRRSTRRDEEEQRHGLAMAWQHSWGTASEGGGVGGDGFREKLRPGRR